MSDELSAARRVLARLSPAAFVEAITATERSQLLQALMEEAGMKIASPVPVILAWSCADQVEFREEPPMPWGVEAAVVDRPFVSRGGGALHWVPAWGELREVHALDADVTACGLSLRPGRRFHAATSDRDFGASEGGRCRRCWSSFRAAGGVEAAPLCGRPDPDPRMEPCSEAHGHDGPHVHSGEIVRPNATVDDWNEALAAWTRRQP